MSRSPAKAIKVSKTRERSFKTKRLSIQFRANIDLYLKLLVSALSFERATLYAGNRHTHTEIICENLARQTLQTCETPPHVTCALGERVDEVVWTTVPSWALAGLEVCQVVAGIPRDEREELCSREWCLHAGAVR